VRRPVDELKEKVGPLLSATSKFSGASLAGRIKSLSSITGMLGQAAGMATASGRDPIRRFKRRLGIDAKQRTAIEAEVESVVRAAIEEAQRPEEVQP
jgi:uncharacterized protein YfiM (DUF2279 family)